MEIIGNLTLVYNKYASENKCINFKTKENEDELIAQFIHRSIDAREFQQDGDSILIPLNYEDAINYNYCYFNNIVDGRDAKRYFCYITSYEYVEPMLTRITIQVDTLQTFFFDIEKMRGNLDRCHAPRRINIGTTDEPKYLINPDLYYMEDSVDDYQVEVKKEGNGQPNYLVLLFALEESQNDANTWEQGTLDKNGYWVDKDLLTFTIVVEVSWLRPILYLGSPIKSIGTTNIYCAVIRADDSQPATISDVSTASYKTFLRDFPLLRDKIIDAFLIDDCRSLTLIENGLGGAYNPVASVSVETLFREHDSHIYTIGESTDTFHKIIVELEKTDALSPFKWTNKDVDNQSLRTIEQEKKLDLYPYSFVNINSMSLSLTWKYQEQYKTLMTSAIEDKCYSFITWFDPIDTQHIMYGTIMNDYNNLVSVNIEDNLPLYEVEGYNINAYGQHYHTYIQGTSLSNLAVYLSQYTQYLNYQKAIVDANNRIATTNAVADIVGAGGQYATQKQLDQEYLNTFVTKKGKKMRKYQRAERDVARSRVGSKFSTMQRVAGATIDIVSTYTRTALNESAIKKQPLVSVTNGSGNNQMFTFDFDIYRRNKEWVLLKYKCKDRLASIYEQKFYNYGYHIPVDIELTGDEFINIISNRKYFCYVGWNSLEIESYIPTIYVNDIIERLTDGVRFENVGDNLLYQTYTQNHNNYETSIPTKPFFVREY